MHSPAKYNCPQCRQPTSWADNPDRPFCSERCRMIDLGAWIEENYRIPDDTSVEAAEDFEEGQ